MYYKIVPRKNYLLIGINDQAISVWPYEYHCQ